MLSFLSQENSSLPPVCTKGRSSPNLFLVVASYHTFLRNQVHNFPDSAYAAIWPVCWQVQKELLWHARGWAAASVIKIDGFIMATWTNQSESSKAVRKTRPHYPSNPSVTMSSRHCSALAEDGLHTHCCPQFLRYPENAPDPAQFPMPGTLHGSLGISQPAIRLWAAEFPPMQLDFPGNLCFDSDSSQCVPSTFLSLEISQTSIFQLALKGWKTLC